MKRIEMNKKTAEALDKSIVKWEKIVLAMKADKDFEFPGSDNCPLCKLYSPYGNSKVSHEKACVSCPIYEVTGEEYCEGTSYREFLYACDIMDQWFDDSKIQEKYKAKRQIEAEEMLKFLESIREKSEVLSSLSSTRVIT